MIHKESMVYLLQKEQLILAFPKDKMEFSSILTNIFEYIEFISCPLLQMS